MIFDEFHAIQRRHGYLPPAELRALSRRMDVPLERLHGVASFYPHFRLRTPARAEVRVCADMSCHLRGACELKAGLERIFAGQINKQNHDGSGPDGHSAPSELDERNKTSELDERKKIVLRDVSCLGRCDAAPALSINDHIYGGVSIAEAESLVLAALRGDPLPRPPQFAERPSQRVACASDPYSGAEKYGVLRRLAASSHSKGDSKGDFDGALATLKASELRGLGGAGFPTEAKWQLVRRAPAAEKYIICNADESEPGTFKDRFILTHLPFLVVEGMIVAGLVTGAKHGVLYLRHEYEEQEHILAEEIERCRRAGLLGETILGSDLTFDIEISVSPGGYICGEESALLEAIEGKRAEPRNKPPFPGQAGLWGQPTVINNVETFANVPQILERGADWYKSRGVNGAAGLKFIGVSGQVRRPGVFEVPMGTPASELIFKHAGGVSDGLTLKAFAPSGPSSGFLPASMADVPMDFKSLAAAGSMLGSGAMVVCASNACMLDMALNAVRFFRNESCGKCVPCRVGSQKMAEMLTGWTQGSSSPGDFALLDELSEAMKLTSICGLGQVVPVPIASVLKYFRDEVEEHITRRECLSGVCFRSTAAAQHSEERAQTGPA